MNIGWIGSEVKRRLQDTHVKVQGPKIGWGSGEAKA